MSRRSAIASLSYLAVLNSPGPCKLLSRGRFVFVVEVFVGEALKDELLNVLTHVKCYFLRRRFAEPARLARETAHGSVGRIVG